MVFFIPALNPIMYLTHSQSHSKCAAATGTSSPFMGSTVYSHSICR